MDNSTPYFLGIMYIVAGLAHFIWPKAYVKIMPKWIPWHLKLVYLSGLLEVLVGLLVLFPQTQTIGAWGIIAVLIGVFPANVDMLITNKSKKWWLVTILWIRLPTQGFLVYWAWLFT